MRVKNIIRRLSLLMVMLIALTAPVYQSGAAEEDGEPGFDISDFEITGNSIFQTDRLRNAVMFHTGAGKTATDVEKARDAIEKLYHDSGYPAVMVNIPEQTLKDGVVKLQVIESRIGRVLVTGNRYFTMEKVMRDLPSFTPGGILYLPKVQQEISRLNRSQDIKVDPVISPGKESGTIDVELKVEDRLPLHGYLELNNRSSHDTKELRLNAMLRYDNLWQKQHSVALQYQTGPQDTKEVQVLGGSYVLPAPWDDDHQFVFYGIWSDSDTAFGEGFNIIGDGYIIGMRYMLPLPQYRLFGHNISFGTDYKHFNQSLGFQTESGNKTKTPVTYLPLTFSYSASLPDGLGGVTHFSGNLNVSFRGIVSDEREFGDKRYKARSNYLYAVFGIQRTQKLPFGMGLFAKVDAQLSDQPLIDNEQYNAGGMESVRGYKESEAAGDNALHGVLEVSFPDPLERAGIGKWFNVSPFIFYDTAQLYIKENLPGQEGRIRLQGTGAGIRGSMKHVEYEAGWAFALNSTDRTRSGDNRVHFRVKALF